jgi:hypothetical protein
VNGSGAVLLGRLAIVVRQCAEDRRNRPLGGRLALRPDHNRRVADAKLTAALGSQEVIECGRICEGRGSADRRVQVLRLSIGGESVTVERDQSCTRRLCSLYALDGGWTSAIS